MTRRFVLLTLLLSLPARADWQFGPAVDVSGPRVAYHHIEASGRQALAVSAGAVAVAWEDDRDGTPRCRVAIRAGEGDPFREHAFGQGECYAPGLAALADGRFAAIWEDEAGVGVAVVGAGGPGPVARLAPTGGQGVLAWHPRHGLMAAWSQPDGRWRRMQLANLSLEGDQPVPGPARPVDPEPAKDDQLYPALTASPAGYTLAWEDRRLGHTVIFASRYTGDGNWTPPRRISQNQTGKAQGTDLGRGTGAMRPALTAYGNRLAAVWLDKRDFLSGYDVYVATAADADGQFGRNAKAQDSFGDAIAQWHPATAGNARGDLAVVWDDDRDGNPDIWLTRPDGDGWTDNIAAAADGNPQRDPALALDETGNLHLAWIEKQPDGRAGIRYRIGRPLP